MLRRCVRLLETRVLVRVLTLAFVAVLAGGFKTRSPEMTSSIVAPAASQRALSEVHELRARLDAGPTNLSVAMDYACALRPTNQNPQTIAVLQKAAIRNPRDNAVLADADRLSEAAEVLQNLHTPT